MSQEAQIGLVGLAVMGQNLVLNMNDRGYRVAVYNRTREKTDDFLAGPASGREIYGAYSPEQFVSRLERPRKIVLMVKAGSVVDSSIEKLLPYLEPGDLLIDGGNSHYPDTERRTAELAEKGLLYIGTGVSGGEEGARHGPSIMPGGNEKAWPLIKDIFQAIAARTPDDEPCCDWVGKGGAGHYVKMVHNGIEYGDMQLIGEAYHLMKDALGMSHDEMASVFRKWNDGPLQSYLIEITGDILGTRDEDGAPLVEKILDTAGQKGTGKWTVVDGAQLGIPITLIAEAVFSRCLSARKDERIAASQEFQGVEPKLSEDRDAVLADLEHALLAAKISSYAQGFMLIREASREHGWHIDYGAVATMWRGGCIIRSAFLSDIKRAFRQDPELVNLIVDPHFREVIAEAVPGWRRTITRGVQSGIPLPSLSSALAFFDGYRTARLPANLLQAQRDYFGAHTYERVDQPRGRFFHTNWTGRGGDVASGSYEV